MASPDTPMPSVSTNRRDDRRAVEAEIAAVATQLSDEGRQQLHAEALRLLAEQEAEQA